MWTLRRGHGRLTGGATVKASPYLPTIHHGQSAWNLENRFTGWWDVDVTEKGAAEARAAGELMAAKGLDFDMTFTSLQTRAIKTLNLALEAMGRLWLPVEKDWRLNERHYGGLTGLDKAETAAKYGEAQVHIWRRSYDVPPPGGESLKDTVARALPYFVTDILPRVMAGERVLVAAHGNSLRALIMVLDRLTPDQIVHVELATGQPIVYRLKADTSVASKDILKG